MKFLVSILLLVTALLFAAEVQVTIYHTSDIHGAMPQLLQVGSILAGRDAQSSLHIDTGDTIQGSILATFSQGEAPLVALQAMKCDVWVPGNHEFDFGVQRFHELAEMMRPWILAGNLHPVKPETAPYPAWQIFNCNGAKVVVIGATASYLRNWFLRDMDAFYTVESARSMLKKHLPEIMAQKPDAVILAAHQGWMGRKSDPRGVNEIASLSYEFPEIDLFLGGHTHRAFAGQAIGRNGWYVQPAFDGKFIGEVTLFCDTDRHEVDRITSRLLPVTPETPPAPQVSAALERWQQQAAEYSAATLAPPPAKTIVAYGTPGVNCPMSELLATAICKESAAECALHSALSRAPLTAGEVVTGAKLFQVVPYENSIVTCMVTADELAQIVAEQWSIRKSYTYCGLYGAEATIQPDGKVVITSINGQPPKAGRRYKLALNSYTASGNGRLPVLRKILDTPEACEVNTGMNTREAFRKLLQQPIDANWVPRRWLTIVK